MAFENIKNQVNATNNMNNGNNADAGVSAEQTMTVDFSKFDQALDADTIAKLNSIPQKSNFVEIPEGTYNASLEDLCLKETKFGKLMISIKMKILDGDFANQNWYISYFPVTNENRISNIQLALANKLISQLWLNTEKIIFEGKWADYAKKLAQVLAFAQANVGHYVVEYTSTMSGQYKNKNYEIMDAFGKA